MASSLSPLYSALVLLFFFLVHSPSSACAAHLSNETDMLALLAMKAQITHDPHKILASWNSSIHFCNWYGIKCSNLHQRVAALNLSSLSLTGTLSPRISNLTFLKALNLELNFFRGVIPPEITRLFRLRQLNLSSNSFSGEIPANLSLCSDLEVVRLGWNLLSGEVPAQLGTLQKVEIFHLHHNSFTGKIPESFGNLSCVQSLSFAGNNFHGRIPSSLGNLKNLNFLDLGFNQFCGEIPLEIFNLTSLVALSFPYNQLEGSFPSDLGVTLPNLQVLNVGNNMLKGPLPVSLSNASNLYEFDATDNGFNGKVLIDFRGLSNLWSLVLASNPLGTEEFGDLDFLDYLINCRSLKVLDLSNCRFGGALPFSIANLSTNLSLLRLGGNEIRGSISVGFENLVNLTELQLQTNKLSGLIPAGLSNLSKLQLLDLSENQLSGYIPSSLSNLTQLFFINLSNNHFSGSIPPTFGDFKFLQVLDLSHNNLSGGIPQFLQRLPLKNLNLSFNQLEGEIPTEGVFTNSSAFSVYGNDKVCGRLPGLTQATCSENEAKKRKSHHFKLMVPFLCGVLALVLILFLIIRRRRLQTSPSSETTLLSKISYDDLHKATEGFSSANLLGVGSSGSVYKATLEIDPKLVAVKVFRLQSRGNFKTFMSECRNITHPNLVKIYTFYLCTDLSGSEFRALVYEYMANGSLERWLHSINSNEDQRSLGLLERLTIAIGVASALDYLHHHCNKTIIHGNLKPSNILLDDDMVARVADFGLSRLICDADNPPTTSYAAPEYGNKSNYTPEGDVYSLGVVLLEMFTGKRPTDSAVEDGGGLHGYLSTALSEGVDEVMDPILVQECKSVAESEVDRERECVVSIMRIGVACSMEQPEDRMDIADVVKELELIKGILLAFSAIPCSSTSGSLRFEGSSSRSAAHNWPNVL